MGRHQLPTWRRFLFIYFFILRVGNLSLKKKKVNTVVRVDSLSWIGAADLVFPNSKLSCLFLTIMNIHIEKLW